MFTSSRCNFCSKFVVQFLGEKISNFFIALQGLAPSLLSRNFIIFIISICSLPKSTKLFQNNYSKKSHRLGKSANAGLEKNHALGSRNQNRPVFYRNKFWAKNVLYEKVRLVFWHRFSGIDFLPHFRPGNIYKKAIFDSGTLWWFQILELKDDSSNLTKNV